MTFRSWFRYKLKGHARDIARHGADAGYPHLTYNHEVAKIFDRYAEEIWRMAVIDADYLGCKNVAEMIAGFGRADMLDDWTTFKVLMVWFACEKLARELVDNEPELLP